MGAANPSTPPCFVGKQWGSIYIKGGGRGGAPNTEAMER